MTYNRVFNFLALFVLGGFIFSTTTLSSRFLGSIPMASFTTFTILARLLLVSQ